MRNRHAAALILLGYSLMEPPPLQSPWWSQYWPWSGGHAWNLAAPLSRWNTRDEFGTLKQCQDGLAVMFKENAEYLTSSIQTWQCVAKDDPRLKPE